MIGTYVTHSPEETINLGKQLAQQLSPKTTLCFFGDLAAGKTTFIKGIVEELSGHSADSVCSPTFSYLNIYEGKQSVFHFDLYRLRFADEFLDMGFDDYFYANGICCIEWSERITNIIPKNALTVELSHFEQDNTRKISVRSHE